MQDLIELVKNKLRFVPKEQLIDYALKHGHICDRKITASDVVTTILNVMDINMASELVKLFGHKIGYTATELQERLLITKSERQKWTKKSLLKVTGNYTVREYGRYIECPIYDALQEITQDDIASWRAAEKPLTERQKEGLQKGRITAIKNRTCVDCGSIENHKEDLKDGRCRYCNNKKLALDRRRYWIEHKDKYCIVDTETTGLTSYDQVIEIAIIDLEGNVLLNTLCIPTVEISDDAAVVHGIDKYVLREAKAPSWVDIYPEVKRILDDRIMLAYNADFDERMILQTCRYNNVNSFEFISECIMHNVMKYYSSEQYIALQEVSSNQQNHRALGDCLLCLDLIKQV